MLATLAAPTTDVDAVLRELPPDFRFVVGNEDQQERVLDVIVRLLAEELIRGNAATAELNRFIQATHAHQVSAWFGNMRLGLREMVEGELILGETDEEQAVRDLAAAEKAVASAEKKLAAARQALDEAQVRCDGAKDLTDSIDGAKRALATQDVRRQAAWAHFKAIRQ